MPAFRQQGGLHESGRRRAAKDPNRARALFEAIEQATEHPGHWTVIRVQDLRTYAFARNDTELSFLIAYATSLGWIESSIGGNTSSFRITPKGFEELEGRLRFLVVKQSVC